MPPPATAESSFHVEHLFELVTERRAPGEPDSPWQPVVLGAGQYANVYLARARLRLAGTGPTGGDGSGWLVEKVAAKVFRDDAPEDCEEVFRAEVEHLRSIGRHDRIVGLRGAIERLPPTFVCHRCGELFHVLSCPECRRPLFNYNHTGGGVVLACTGAPSHRFDAADARDHRRMWQGRPCGHDDPCGVINFLHRPCLFLDHIDLTLEQLDTLLADPTARVHERGLPPSLDDDRAWRQLAMVYRLRSLAEAADGLAGAHRIGVLHGDLAPDNIMVDVDEDAEIPIERVRNTRLIDLGEARAFGGEHVPEAIDDGAQDDGHDRGHNDGHDRGHNDGHDRTVRTRDRTRRPGARDLFAAPEVRDGGDVPPQVPADIYAFGCVIAWMVTGGDRERVAMLRLIADHATLLQEAIDDDFLDAALRDDVRARLYEAIPLAPLPDEDWIRKELLLVVLRCLVRGEGAFTAAPDAGYEGAAGRVAEALWRVHDHLYFLHRTRDRIVHWVESSAGRITTLESELAEAKQDLAVVQQDLAEKSAAVELRAEAIAELTVRHELSEKVILQKDTQLRDREQQLREREQQVRERDARLREREAQIRERDRFLAEAARVRQELEEQSGRLSLEIDHLRGDMQSLREARRRAEQEAAQRAAVTAQLSAQLRIRAVQLVVAILLLAGAAGAVMYGVVKLRRMATGPGSPPGDAMPADLGSIEAQPIASPTVDLQPIALQPITPQPIALQPTDPIAPQPIAPQPTEPIAPQPTEPIAPQPIASPDLGTAPVDGGVRPPPSPAELERRRQRQLALDEAESLFQQGMYEAARGAVFNAEGDNIRTRRGWDIYGRASCAVGNAEAAKDAWTSVRDKATRDRIRRACAAAGIDL